MALFKCKMCGGDLVLTEGNPLATCEYCGTTQTVPSADNEKKLTLFARANRLRLGCEFDKAAGVYEAIVADFPEEAEAYWGLVLCKFGIEYVDDPATGKKVPTCHRSSFNTVMEDPDFEQTMENSDAIARRVYREEAKQIEELRKGILEVSSKADPYDIFICYKETDEKGDRTLDSVMAQDLYDALTDKGYKVFFSRITLEDKLGQEYEPYIFAALNSAKIMLAVGTDYEYYNAVWVRNEWSRYLKLMAEDHTKHLIPCYKGIDAYDIPKEFAKLQAQDLGKVGATQDLLRGIEKLIAPATATVVNTQSNNVAELLQMGNESLQAGEWQLAGTQFDLALVADPKNADAYLGKLMAENKCKERSQLAKAKKPLHKNALYKQALAYANESLKQELEEYSAKQKKVLKRRTAVKALGAVVGAAAVVLVVLFALETQYRNILNDFYSGIASAEETYQSLSDMEWYKKADESTQRLLRLTNKGWYSGAKESTDIIIPVGVKTIKADFFKGCAWITSLTISEGVTQIGSFAFEDCTGLTSVTIPSSVTKIGNAAFQGCTNLTTVTIGNGTASIGSSAFAGCTRLASVTIGDGVTSIGAFAFESCRQIVSISIPNGVTYIGERAFYACRALTSVTIPSSVTKIGVNAFASCNGSLEIHCEAESQPSGFEQGWTSGSATVIWGYKGE